MYNSVLKYLAGSEIPRSFLLVMLFTWSLTPLPSYAAETKNNHKNQSATTACDSKRHCKEMTSCEEAMEYMRQCALTSLDKDKDGIPCESLCKSKKPKQ